MLRMNYGDVTFIPLYLIVKSIVKIKKSLRSKGQY